MHYVGVVLLVIGAPTPFVVQTEWSALSLVLILIAAVSVIAWLYSIHCHSEPKGLDNKDAVKRVHTVSLRCLIFESIAILMCSVSATLYVYHLRDSF